MLIKILYILHFIKNTTARRDYSKLQHLESDIPLIHYLGIINMLMTFVKLRMKTGLKEVLSC